MQPKRDIPLVLKMFTLIKYNYWTYSRKNLLRQEVYTCIKVTYFPQAISWDFYKYVWFFHSVRFFGRNFVSCEVMCIFIHICFSQKLIILCISNTADVQY